MASLDYFRLYGLQDQVLEAVFTTEKEFYLTGGTCLSEVIIVPEYEKKGTINQA